MTGDEKIWPPSGNEVNKVPREVHFWYSRKKREHWPRLLVTTNSFPMTTGVVLILSHVKSGDRLSRAWRSKPAAFVGHEIIAWPETVLICNSRAMPLRT